MERTGALMLMDLPWVIEILAAIFAFGVTEAYAFKHPERENSLSRFIAGIGAKWPLSIGICGAFCGTLMTHFFWHFCPDAAASVGELLMNHNYVHLQVSF
jgi:hypothetical protein